MKLTRFAKWNILIEFMYYEVQCHFNQQSNIKCKQLRCSNSEQNVIHVNLLLRTNSKLTFEASLLVFI